MSSLMSRASLQMSAALDPLALRRVFSTFPTGVVAVAGMDRSEPVGIAASSFTPVSLDPPLVSICVAHSSTTWPRLRVLGRLGLSVLSAGQESDCRRLSAKEGDRFEDVDWCATADGAVFINNASAWLDCRIEAHVGGGDHDIVVFRVLETADDVALPPLVFHGSRFRRLEAVIDP